MRVIDSIAFGFFLPKTHRELYYWVMMCEGLGYSPVAYYGSIYTGPDV